MAEQQYYCPVVFVQIAIFYVSHRRKISYQVNLALRVWIDVLTPKQTLFFAPVYHLLKKAGHDVLVTTRLYREAQQALRFKKIPHSVIGRHGGGDLFGKLMASGERVLKLGSVVSQWQPMVALSFSSPEAARVAFGLGIPHVMANDSPHSSMVARLSVPLSAVVCSPWIISKSTWVRFGAQKVVRYRALDPAAWLKRHKPDPRVLDQMGLERHRPIILLRTEEAFASYLLGKASDRKPVILPVIRELLGLDMELQIVVSTRYGQQAPTIKEAFGRRVKVLDRIIDATSLIAFATAFIGSGGTMTVEAALLGTPAVSCFPGEKPLYIKYLEGLGLVSTIQSPRTIASSVRRFVDEPERFEKTRSKARKLLDWMEDPAVKILSVVKDESRE